MPTYSQIHIDISGISPNAGIENLCLFCDYRQHFVLFISEYYDIDKNPKCSQAFQ